MNFNFKKNVIINKQRSKVYNTYLILVLSFFQIYRSYTIDSNKTTALVWYFFPDEPFEIGLTYISYMGIIAGLGGFLAIYVQNIADKKGRKPILVLISFIMAFMSLVQLITSSIILFTLASFFIRFAGSVHVWMLYISEEAPKGKNAKWSNLILMVGIIGPIAFSGFRFFFITNDKNYTIQNWKNILYFSIIIGFIVTILILITFRETSTFLSRKENEKIRHEYELNSLKSHIRSIFHGKDKRNYIVLLIITFVFSIGFGAGKTIEPYIMNYSIVSSKEYSIIVLISLILSAFLMYIITGCLADKYGRKPILLLYSSLCPILIYLQYLWFSHIEITYIRIFLMIISTTLLITTRGGIWSLLTILSFELLPKKVRAVGNGLQSFIMVASGLLNSLIISPFYPVFGIQSIALIQTLFFFPLIPLIIVFIPETRNLDLNLISVE